MKLKNLFFLFFMFFLFAACEKEEAPVSEPIFEPVYSFFVAGHTYGHFNQFESGMHPPFRDYIDSINAYPTMSLGILTGDLVPYSTPMYWDSAQTTMARLQMPIHIAAGNHDRGPEFEKRFGDYYFSFQQENDLFIILSPTDWNIEGDQEVFLRKTIDSLQSEVNHIFIFMHELVWWSPDNIFRNINLNFNAAWPGSNNFYTDIEPYLKSVSKNIVLFAGDLGAKGTADSFMYYKEDNLTYIGSGMGNRTHDNIIIVDVDKDGQIRYQLTHINGGDPNGLGKLEDYQLP